MCIFELREACVSSLQVGWAQHDSIGMLLKLLVCDYRVLSYKHHYVNILCYERSLLELLLLPTVFFEDGRRLVDRADDFSLAPKERQDPEPHELGARMSGVSKTSGTASWRAFRHDPSGAQGLWRIISFHVDLFSGE